MQVWVPARELVLELMSRIFDLGYKRVGKNSGLCAAEGSAKKSLHIETYGMRSGCRLASNFFQNIQIFQSRT